MAMSRQIVEQLFHHTNDEGKFTTSESPDMKETFNRMWGIIDTNHLTHEFNVHDQEVLDFAPDIPIPSFSLNWKKYYV